jgi:phosphatidylglycerol:prolipoprotein diacylglycerol transferase
MIRHPNIDPVLVSLGPVAVHWYGAMFLVAFAVIWGLARLRAASAESTWTGESVDQLVFWCAIGAIVVGRLGWLLLHGLKDEARDPLLVLRIWEGGMSFHGGALGVFLALLRFARHRYLRSADVLDFVAPLVPVALLAVLAAQLGRGELWGMPGRIPGLVIRHGLPRYPGELYEAALEGLLLGGVLWLFTQWRRPRLAPTALLLIGYGLCRFVVELARLPDVPASSRLLGWLTDGQLLALPAIAVGLLLMAVAYQRRQPSGNARPWPQSAT